MKKILLTSLILCFFVSFVYAQEVTDDSVVFVKTAPILRVLAHELGYKIYYTKHGIDVGVFYIPYSWFSQAGGKGQVIWGKNKAYPYFTIFWVDGKLDHINVYLQENMQHYSWGILNATVTEVKDKFDVDPDTFKVEF
ncbi:MAG: hypothetical protein JW969_20755 [Spirochaetales bacterium]|nr:hypothetical protein [Spirochaetales bacterium]